MNFADTKLHFIIRLLGKGHTSINNVYILDTSLGFRKFTSITITFILFWAHYLFL